MMAWRIVAGEMSSTVTDIAAWRIVAVEMSSTVIDLAGLEDSSSRDVFNCARPCWPGRL